MTPEQAEWARKFWPLNKVKSKPPPWLIPGLLPPGVTLLAGPPKTYKTRLVLKMIAALREMTPVGHESRKPVKKGSVAYFGAEQKPGRIKDIYETHILRKKLKATAANWDLIMPRSVYRWQIDEFDEDYSMADFIRSWQPTLTVIDPLVNFHSMDENDPRLIKPLVPLKEAVDSFGGAILIVHHMNKNGGTSENPFKGVRGTSALWGMCDGGILLRKIRSNLVEVTTDFKDHEGGKWKWKVNGS